MIDYALRDYQVPPVESAIRYLESGGNRGVLHLPCGAGKSWIYAEIAKRMNLRTVILQPNKELAEQNLDKMNQVGLGSECGIMCAGLNRKQKNKFFTFATHKTLISHLSDFKDVGLVIVDECDYVPPDSGTQIRKVLKHFDKAKVLGGTATPFRLNYFSGMDGIRYTDLRLIHRQFRGYWKDVIYSLSPQYLIDKGFLTPTSYKDWSQGYDESKLKVNTTHSDFTERSINEYLTREEQIERHFKAIMYSLEHRNFVLSFTPSIKASHEIKNELEKAGISCGVVSSKTNPYERRNLLKRFKDGDVRVVLNTNILTAGFDFPELDCVIFGRPTLSLRTLVQSKGRGDRIAKGKDSFWFVDLCNNLKRFGTVESLHLRFKNQITEKTMPSGKVILQKKNLDELWNARERVDNKVLSSYAMM